MLLPLFVFPLIPLYDTTPSEEPETLYVRVDTFETIDFLQRLIGGATNKEGCNQNSGFKFNPLKNQKLYFIFTTFPCNKKSETTKV